MAINTQVLPDDWEESFVSDGNHGRFLSLEVLDPKSGSSGQVKQRKLIAVDYDAVENRLTGSDGVGITSSAVGQDVE